MILLSLGLSLISLYKFHTTTYSFDSDLDGDNYLGEVKVIDGRMRFKRNNLIEWSSFTTKETKVKNLDRIHTDEKSRAHIHLNGIGDIELAEKSIIRVSYHDDTIELGEGNVILKMQKGKKLTIKVGRKSIKAFASKQGATLSINSNKQEISVVPKSIEIETRNDVFETLNTIREEEPELLVREDPEEFEEPELPKEESPTVSATQEETEEVVEVVDRAPAEAAPIVKEEKVQNTPVVKVKSVPVRKEGPAPKKIEPKIQKEAEKKTIFKAPLPSSWLISLDYGTNYFNYNQSGVLGTANIGLNILNTFKISSLYTLGDFATRLSFDTYTLKYQSQSTLRSKKINSFELLAGYGSFFAGFGFNGNPIFKNESGNVLLSDLSTLDFTVLYNKTWALKTQRKTTLSWDAGLTYALSASSSNADIDVSDITSYSFKSTIKLTRVLLDRKSYLLLLHCPLYGSYRSTETNITWTTSQGEATSTSWEIGARVGLELEF